MTIEDMVSKMMKFYSNVLTFLVITILVGGLTTKVVVDAQEEVCIPDGTCDDGQICGTGFEGTDNCGDPCFVYVGTCVEPDETCVGDTCVCAICDVPELTPSSPTVISEPGGAKRFFLPISVGDQVTCTVQFENSCILDPYSDGCACYNTPDSCASNSIVELTLRVNEYAYEIYNDCIGTTTCEYGPAAVGDKYLHVGLYVDLYDIIDVGQATLQCDKTTVSNCYVDNTCTTNICADFSDDNQAFCIITEEECADYGAQGWSTDGGATCNPPSGGTADTLGFCYCDDLCPSEDVKFDHGVLLTQTDCESINFNDAPCSPDSATSCLFTSYSWHTFDGGSTCIDFTKALEASNDPFACGDPHFLTFGGKPYEYHGECDLVLISNPSFANGWGLDVHARTTRDYKYSYINELGLRIGDDILEIHSMGEFKINGVPGDLTNTTITKFGDYNFAHWHSGKAYFHRYYIKIGDTSEKFDIRAFENIIYFEVNAGQEHVLKDSKGMLGDEVTGMMLGRDGVTVIEDPEEFAAEWQVRDTDVKLFSTDRFPQFPDQCLPAFNFTPNLAGQSKIELEDQAEKLCASAGWLTETEKKNCIFDIVATGNTELIKYKEIEADAFEAEKIHFAATST